MPKIESIVIDNIGPWLVPLLRELPGLLAPEQPHAVAERLYPDPTDNHRANKEWRRIVVPELRALLASARELVEKDLESLAPAGKRKQSWRLVIPTVNLRAWISALNAARLALGARYHVEDVDLERESESIDDEREAAIWRVHVYGTLQATLIDHVPY